MSYARIDPTIQAWIKEHGLKLFTRMEGSTTEMRNVYVSSSKGECFQIWIDEPDADNVEVHAADVETEEDKEFRKDWRIPLAQVGSALEEALTQVRAWMTR